MKTTMRVVQQVFEEDFLCDSDSDFDNGIGSDSDSDSYSDPDTDVDIENTSESDTDEDSDGEATNESESKALLERVEFHKSEGRAKSRRSDWSTGLVRREIQFWEE
jgi:hypothetical protein